ncbi:hypothetical protein H4R18_000633, partial [Coemansia javaensis]
MYTQSALVATLLVLALLATAAAQAATKPVVVGYYPSWKKAQTASIDLGKYTHINIAFAIPQADGTITFDDSFSIPDAVTGIQAKNAKAILSIGGWSGSNLISTILKDPATNAKFLDSMVALVDQYKLDGLDLDWEYPGRLGNACNVFDAANDTPNYLKFVQSLRAALDAKYKDSKKLITMAVYVQPFFVDGKPSDDVSAFAKVVDYAHMMQYDINGAWDAGKMTGPNAPLEFEAGKGAQVSFASAIDAWTGAKWPANQLTAGFAFYGRMVTASEDMSANPKNQYQLMTGALTQGDPEDFSWPDKCAGTNTPAGQWQWKFLRSEKILTSPTEAAAPWTRYWDDTTKTPWLFNSQTKAFISYDDPQSIKAKVDYAVGKGLAGAMVWSINMDYENELID